MMLGYSNLYGVKKTFKNEITKIDDSYYLLEG